MVGVHRLGHLHARVVRTERLAPACPPPGPCRNQSSPGPFLQEPAFELGERGKEMEDQFAGCTRGLKCPVAEGAKPHVPLEQLRNQRHQMGHGPPEAIQALHDERVAGG
jgi:hypothetical protein